MVKIKKSQVFPKRPRFLNIQNSQKDLLISKAEIKRVILLLLQNLRVQCDEISVYFVTKREIARLHQTHFNDPTPTDTISFPLDPPGQKPHCHLGEVFVCPGIAVDYAQKRGKDPYDETILYMVHGILHLIGYDDQEAEDRRKMRRKERECMKFLRNDE